MSLTIGSLFSGIGGLELGLEWAGLGPTLWQVEQDEYCRAVLAKHWPNATRYEDVRHVGGGNLAPVDVICGGFPCQDISLAGKGAGLSGDRSGLWSEYRRIIGEVRPRYVVVENVAALLARGLGDVLGDLAALGYDAWWDCVPAVSVGAPHRRDRLFLVAYPNGERELQPQGSVANERRRTRDRRSAMADANSTRWADTPRRAGPAWPNGRTIAGANDVERGALQWESEPDVGRVAHGVRARVDRLRALGNAVVPQVAQIIGEVVLAIEAQRYANAPSAPRGEEGASSPLDHGAALGAEPEVA